MSNREYNTNVMAKKRSNHKYDEDGPEEHLRSVLASHFSNLHHHLFKNQEDTDSLKVIRRGKHDWLAILNAFDHAGTPIVAFGEGQTFVGALASLSGNIGAGRFKVDKFRIQGKK